MKVSLLEALNLKIFGIALTISGWAFGAIVAYILICALLGNSIVIMQPPILNLIAIAVLISALGAVGRGFINAGVSFEIKLTKVGYIGVSVGIGILFLCLYYVMAGLMGKIPSLLPQSVFTFEGTAIPLPVQFTDAIALGIIIIVLAGFGSYFIKAGTKRSLSKYYRVLDIVEG